MADRPVSPSRKKQRRGFLKSLGAGIAGSLAGPVLASSTVVPRAPAFPGGRSLAHSVQDEAYWQMVKRQFDIREGMIMVNAANLCPRPHFVEEKVHRLTQNLGGDVSFQNRAKFGEERARAVKRLAGFLNAGSEEIAITRNTTESNNIVVNGLDLGPGDEVLIWEQNHPTNHIAWAQKARRYGFSVKSIGLPAHPASEEELVEAFSAAITPRTKVMGFSHISNVSGLALPAKALCTLARANGILSLVDGAQSFGFLDLDLQDLGCDFFSGSMHKWLMGPMEHGVLFARKEHLDRLWPNIIGAGWEEGSDTLDEKVGVLGQRNTPATPAICDILDFHEKIGKKQVEARIRALNARLKEGLAAHVPHIEFVTPLESGLSGGITISKIPEREPVEIFRKLYDEHGIAAAPTGGLRLSPTIYCTMEDMDKVVQAVAEVSRS